ncbi:hypothetical protein [Halegenticoccus tardaugens]|uniref:hypothetical protein n=1 Tax=Halegenticoccus tardaugens TaxID=2071624 RepID=UPI001E2B6AD0|nr:hypothetical protein [Halegenticoccus tardaugens]
MRAEGVDLELLSQVLDRELLQRSQLPVARVVDETVFPRGASRTEAAACTGIATSRSGSTRSSLSASSHGEYFHERVRGQYDYRRIR